MLLNHAALLARLPVRLADPAPGIIKNPSPVSPIQGAGVQTLLGYAMWGALISGGILAVGQLSNNPGHADKGKRALLYALGGVAIAAIAIPTIDTVFSTVKH